MPLTLAQINQLIDDSIKDSPARNIKPLTVRTLLKALMAWAPEAALSAWFKLGTSTPSLNATDTVYHTGKVIVGSNTDDTSNAALQVNGNLRARNGITAHTNSTAVGVAMAALPFGTQAALQVMGNQANMAAFLEFHVQGLRIDQIGVDIDGRFKFHPWSSAATYEVILDAYNAMIRANNAIQNRKFVVYDEFGNEHQFMGLGVNSGLMRYQVPFTTNDHVFFAGTSAASSTELMRIKGNGSVGIGIGPNPKNGLELGRGWLSVVSNCGNSTPGSGQGISLGWNYSAGGGESNLVWGTGTIPTAWLGFSTWDGTTFTERMRLSASGDLQVNGSITAGSTTSAKDVTSYGTFKSYYGAVLRALRFGGAVTSSSLTLKTTQYVNLEIDGTTYKVALVN